MKLKKILIFAGTTEGRRLSERLAEKGVEHLVSVATEYGELVMREHPCAELLCGRLTQNEMVALMKRHKPLAVVDATHPYAKIATEHIRAAADICQLPYLRLRRDILKVSQTQQIVSEKSEAAPEWLRYFDSHEACAKALCDVDGNILLTTGSKDLAVYAADTDLRKRLFVRVLPSLESLNLCMKQGICGKQLLALQGPFSAKLNEALLEQYDIQCLVTKESGTAGGYLEKIEAAQKRKIPVFVIRCAEEAGFSFQEIWEQLEHLLAEQEAGTEKCYFFDKKSPDIGKESPASGSVHFEITLAGIGMGEEANQTREVWEAIRNADILLGAERMIRGYSARLEKKPYYLASQIIPYLKEKQKRRHGFEKLRVVVLFSGDSGFYSGCQEVFYALRQEIKQGAFHAELRILSGISSVAYLASCLGEAYHDAEILSIHGRSVCNLAKKLAASKRTFLLLSGASDLKRVGELLLQAGLDACEIAAGFRLSYPDQNILFLRPKDCASVTEKGLLTCRIYNPNAKARTVSPSIPDSKFLREQVPMTKEEVRAVSICKLRLRSDSIVYDIGSGTGSIAVEMAALSDSIQVYAIERKEAAAALLRKNQKKFGLENITVVEAEAPEGLSALPVPTHAFIGGSGKKMKEILTWLYQKNPTMRVVINAVSMESICEIKEILHEYSIANAQVIQMQVSRARQAGAYHLMQAENPVWICAFEFVSQ